MASAVYNVMYNFCDGKCCDDCIGTVHVLQCHDIVSLSVRAGTCKCKCEFELNCYGGDCMYMCNVMAYIIITCIAVRIHMHDIVQYR